MSRLSNILDIDIALDDRDVSMPWRRRYPRFEARRLNRRHNDECGKKVSNFVTHRTADGSDVGAPGLVMGPCKYQLEVNRCRNEEIIVKGNFGWVWPMGAGRPRIDRIVIREVQYQFEVNRCRNEGNLVKGNFGWLWSMWAGFEIDLIIIREVQYQFIVNRCRNKEVNFQGSSADSVGGDSGQDGRTAEITTISTKS
ncbi:hypothetical protein DPMN_111827, partial [Dreissena polymorpha]